ncbi:MAG: hypothetical protein IT373_32105 [Polyangiaceae bacterium]|nr:hypothetical protein [Polyangiaceae bacterium]
MVSASLATVAATGSIVAASTSASSHPRVADAPGTAARAQDAARAVAPLAAGGALGPWSVRRVGPFERGALEVELDGPAGSFTLEVMRRDGALPQRAPGMTRHFVVLVKNRGDGATPTDEDQGLGAMALAEVVAANEEHVDRRGFLSQAERLNAHRERLLGDDWPADVDPNGRRPSLA